MRAIRRIDDEVSVRREAEHLWLGGGIAPTRVPGLVLEGAFDLGPDGWLVLTTDDCPYEEGLHILWIARNGGIAGRVGAGAPYCPGICSGIEIGEDGVRYAFPGPDTVSEARITAAPWWRGGGRRLRVIRV